MNTAYIEVYKSSIKITFHIYYTAHYYIKSKLISYPASDIKYYIFEFSNSRQRRRNESMFISKLKKALGELGMDVSSQIANYRIIDPLYSKGIIDTYINRFGETEWNKYTG